MHIDFVVDIQAHTINLRSRTIIKQLNSSLTNLFRLCEIIVFLLVVVEGVGNTSCLSNM